MRGLSAGWAGSSSGFCLSLERDLGRQLSVLTSRLLALFVEREEALELVGVEGTLPLSPPDELDEIDFRLSLPHIPIVEEEEEKGVNRWI